MTARSRIAKLEGSTSEPTIEDWIEVLDAPDQEAALADLQARFPAMLSPKYRAQLDKLR